MYAGPCFLGRVIAKALIVHKHRQRGLVYCTLKESGTWYLGIEYAIPNEMDHVWFNTYCRPHNGHGSKLNLRDIGHSTLGLI